MPTIRESFFEAKELGVPMEVCFYGLKLMYNLNTSELNKIFDNPISDYSLYINAMKGFINGEMIEYHFNRASFCSNNFYINKNVLIPRQETEDLVRQTINWFEYIFGQKKIVLADVCTGSGCIGISIAKFWTNNEYILTDISVAALEVAKKNVEEFVSSETKVTLLNGDMLEPLQGRKVDVIVCNPPYIEDEKTIDSRTWKHEPHLALLAKPCTYFYEKVFKDYKNVTNEKFLLAFEIGEDMEPNLTEMVHKYCSNCYYWFVKDIYNRVRFLFVTNEEVCGAKRA